MEISLNITKWILLLIILSILGLNIFNFLANVTETTGKITKTGIKTGLEGAKKTVNLSEKGTSKIAGGIEKGISTLEKALDIKVIDDKTPSQSDISDIIQTPNKRGFCFIGTDNGYRSCAYVGRNDICMSGDIFPTFDVCINPELRV